MAAAVEVKRSIHWLEVSGGVAMMRVVGLSMLLIGLAAPHAVAAPAGHGKCPTITDPSGDTKGVSDAALDITAVAVDVTPRQITATLRVLGQPDPAALGSARRYDVSFAIPDEGTFILRATVGNGREFYELIDNKTYATSPDNSSVQSWTHVRDLTGSVGQNSVTIVAQRPRDLPITGGAKVFGQSWVSAADAPPVEAGETSVDKWDGAAVGVDDSPEVRMSFGTREPCVRSKA